MPELLTRRDGPIGRISFSNPAKFNAVSREMWEAFPGLIRAHEEDPEVRLIVIDGAGDRAFIAGADISQFGEQRLDDDTQAGYNRAVDAAYLAPIHCTKPVVAKIQGVCMGGGLGLAAACDLRFCRDDARFRMPAARLGLGYGVAGVRRMLRVFGLQNTMDIFFSARIFGAAEAQRMGFVSQVYDAAEFDERVEAWCQDVAQNAPLTLHALKRTVNALLSDSQHLDLSAAEAAIQACFASEDYREGARAFMEKRPATFKGV